MLILRDNRVINVDVHEDSIEDFLIVKSLEQLKKEYASGKQVQDCVGTSNYNFGSTFERSYYYCLRKQSEWNDGSGMTHGLIGISETMGELISSAWKHNYRVYVKRAGKWIELTKDGPIEVPEGTKLYYTKETTSV